MPGNILKSILLLVFTTASHAEDLAIVVNKNVHMGEVSLSQITALFLQQSKKINDHYLTPVDLNQQSEVRKHFYNKLANKTPLQMKAYWSRLVFTGKGEPPMEFDNSAEVLVTVGADQGFIGYMKASEVDDSVRILYRFE